MHLINDNFDKILIPDIRFIFSFQLDAINTYDVLEDKRVKSVTSSSKTIINSHINL